MPKRSDINTILIIGSGPIIIGQACEFDYSGTQACKALKEEGYKVVLLNSNPASIMTDSNIADITYIEPMTIEVIERIIINNKIDAYLPTVGGQKALNFAKEISELGLDKKYNLKYIGVTPEIIEKAENRKIFHDELLKNNIPCPNGFYTYSLDDALTKLKNFSFPVIVRSSFTLGGSGSGKAYNNEEFIRIFNNCLILSGGYISVEEYLVGWKEFELEVVRDSKDNCIVVCSIENLNPMGVHTGDSITVAPTLTLRDKEYQKMRDLAFKVMRVIGVDTGGANVQFALNPENGKIVVIEMNPRVSRSSALASKATGFPIASVAAKIAVGLTLDEIDNNIINKTAAFEPVIDYIVTKIPRFDLEKFIELSPQLNSSMKSVGEVMSIAESFPESLQKALRSLGVGYNGLDTLIHNATNHNIKINLTKRLQYGCDKQVLYIGDAFRQNFSIDEVHALTKWDKWFLLQIKNIIDAENKLFEYGIEYLKENFALYKSLGFSDLQLSKILFVPENDIYKLKMKENIFPVYRRVDACAAEFPTSTSYFYSTYLKNQGEFFLDESNISNTEKKIIIIGSGPNSIGQGIEFDYACVHASLAIQSLGIHSIMINCNPETISTDQAISNKLYLAPLYTEDIIDIIRQEETYATIEGIIISYGGQVALNLGKILADKYGIKVLGNSIKSIDIAEERRLFYEFLDKLNIPHPITKLIKIDSNLTKQINHLPYPIIIRPSYIIGGKSIKLINNSMEFENYISKLDPSIKEVFLERFIDDACEFEIDALSDGEETYIASIIEHLEKAGIHSGDSISVLPYFSIDQEIIDQAINYTTTIAENLALKGLFNIQFVTKNKQLYVIELNPRASRTVPFIIKSLSIPLIDISTKILLGYKLKDFKLEPQVFKRKSYFIKRPVFSNKIIGSKINLGPEMTSTGEEMIPDVDLEYVLNMKRDIFNSNNEN